MVEELKFVKEKSLDHFSATEKVCISMANTFILLIIILKFLCMILNYMHICSKF